MHIETEEVTVSNGHWPNDSRREDVTFTVDYCYYPAIPSNEIDPHEDANVEIQRVILGDVDIYNLLNIDTCTVIETKILEGKR